MPAKPGQWSVIKLSMLPRPPARGRASCVASKVSHSVQPLRRCLSRSLWMRQCPVWKSKSCGPSRSVARVVSLMECSSFMRCSARLGDLLGTGGVEGVVDQQLHMLDEADHAWQADVLLERRRVLPARVDVEEQPVADRPECVDLEAAWLLAGRGEVGDDGLGHRALVAGARVEAREDDQLHVIPPLGPLTLPSR